MSRTRVAVAAAGVALGLLLGFVLPSSWVFVEDGPLRARAGEAGEQYACPMFCVVLGDMPEDGKCPVCGMELAAISGESKLSRAERRMVGLEVAKVARRPLRKTVRVVGEVDYDETRLARITTRTAGWLEQVWVDTTWMPVEKGQRLAAIYSPELYAAQKDYLVADADTRRSVGRRLALLGVSDEEIARLRETGKVERALVLRAPHAGLVVERRAVAGGAVKKGELLYAVADLSRVWVQAEVFERDLVWIVEDQPVRLEVENRPEPILGRVAFIDPVIDRRTRTARVRIEVENPATGAGTRLLRVGQRVDAWITAHVGETLAIPRSAVLATGHRRIAYRLFTESMGKRDYRTLDPAALPEVVFYELTEMRLGPVAEDASGEEFYPVLESELAEGMVIVTKGNLLLDSQAQLSGKPSLLFPEGSRGAGGGHEGH